MTNTDKLLVIARRYCTDYYRFWNEKYQNERSGNDFPYTYTDSDYNLFPRYNVLKAILLGVETLTDKNFQNKEACKDELIKMGMVSNTTFTSGDNNKIELAAMQDERLKFVQFIHEISLNEHSNLEPLPYRRRIIGEEKQEIAEQLWEHWHFEREYWDPILPCSKKPYIFFNKLNLDEGNFDSIKGIIGQFNDRIIEVAIDDGYFYETDWSEFDHRNGEAVYTGKDYEWFIYLSHENTITFAGSKLLDEIERLLGHKKEFMNKW